MKLSYRVLISLLSTSLFFSPAFSQASATVSIYDNPAFKSQRLCALECILCGYGTYGQHDCLGTALNCNESPLQNSCYCRSDLQSAAVSYVASCVSSACSNTIDVNTAVGIYTQYCETADQTSNYIPAPTTQTAITTQVGVSEATAAASSVSLVLSTVTAANGQDSTELVTVTPTAGITQTLTQTAANDTTALITSAISLGSLGSQSTPSNTATTSSSNNLNLGPIIGGVVGGVFILGIAAIIITWLILREKRKHKQMEMRALQLPIALSKPSAKNASS